MLIKQKICLLTAQYIFITSVTELRNKSVLQSLCSFKPPFSHSRKSLLPGNWARVSLCWQLQGGRSPGQCQHMREEKAGPRFTPSSPEVLTSFLFAFELCTALEDFLYMNVKQNKALYLGICFYIEIWHTEVLSFDRTLLL